MIARNSYALIALPTHRIPRENLAFFDRRLTRIRASDRIPRSQSRRLKMAQATGANQKRILGNQKAILANQRKILGNQKRIIAK